MFSSSVRSMAKGEATRNALQAEQERKRNAFVLPEQPPIKRNLNLITSCCAGVTRVIDNDGELWIYVTKDSYRDSLDDKRLKFAQEVSGLSCILLPEES